MSALRVLVRGGISVNFGPRVTLYHAATCISPSLMHLLNVVLLLLGRIAVLRT